MKTFLRLFVLALMAVLLHACATSGASGPVEKWHQFGAGAVQAAGQNQGSVVFIREGDALAGPSVNIFVNGEYLSSLRSGGFKQSMACVGNNRLTAHFTDVSSRYLEKEQQGQMFDVAAGKVRYFKVVNNGAGKPALQSLDTATGEAMARRMQEQAHTMPRVDNLLACRKPVIKPFKTYTLQASALFAFDKSDYANLLPKGKEEIGAIAREVAASQANIERIEVVGYADPEGGDSYNMALSQRRAQTVRQALLEDKLSPSAVKAEGRGAQNLLVTDCRARHPRSKAQRDDCNQPNRRVEIMLYGLQAMPAK